MLGFALIGVLIGLGVVTLVIRLHPKMWQTAFLGGFITSALLDLNGAVAWGFTATVVVAALAHLPIIRTRYPA
jgi:hypothetical protein